MSAILRGAWRACLTALVVACASPGTPPGGPPDPETPKIVRITPDTNAVNVRGDVAVIHFDEVISERPGTPLAPSARASTATQSSTSTRGGFSAPGSSGGGSLGGPDLASIVSVSPSDGRDEIVWRRTAIEIKPRRGFRANTAYRITIAPGVQDLRNNVISVPTEWVFSTGATIPTGDVSGAVFDYGAAKPAPNARVEVYLPSDTVLRWGARADSSGRFTVRDLAPGSYRVRAWIDGNNDRRLGEREASDTGSITLDTRATIDLYAFVRDTMPPRIEQVEFVDSTAIRIRFDRAIVGDWDARGAVTLQASDSTPIALGGALMPTVRYDSLLAAEREAAKQAKAADSTRADSTRADSTAASPATADSIPSIPAPTFDRLAPVQQWTIRLSAPLRPGMYKLKIEGATGLNGRSGKTERDIRVVVPPPKPVPAEPVAATTPPAAAPVTPPQAPVTRPPR